MKFDVLHTRATLRFIPETARPAARPTPIETPRWWVAAIHRLRGAVQAWQEHRRERALLSALARLDDVTLRDLGIRRSEFGSIGAESLGHADPTRLRIVPAHGEVFGDPRNIAVDRYR